MAHTPGLGSSLTGTPSGPLLGRATVRAPGVCGELAQGMLEQHYFLVTCPIDFFARIQVELYENGPGQDGPFIEAPANCPKAVQALEATLSYLGRKDLSGRLTVSNPIPRSKGLGSSSADVAATIAATGLALGVELVPEQVAEIAVAVEPTDGIMFPGIALFDHREGRTVENLGPPPPMEIVALDFGGTVDTLEFNRVDRRPLWQSLRKETDEALRLVRAGITAGDPAMVGRGASISAHASLEVLPRPRLSDVMAFAEEAGAVGVNVAHSGTIIGILLDALPRRGKSTFRRAQRDFPDAEEVHHFRLLGGGLQRVPDNSKA